MFAVLAWWRWSDIIFSRRNIYLSCTTIVLYYIVLYNYYIVLYKVTCWAMGSRWASSLRFRVRTVEPFWAQFPTWFYWNERMMTIWLLSVTLVIACKFDSGIAGRSTSYPRENIEISKSRQKLLKRIYYKSEYRILMVVGTTYYPSVLWRAGL